MERLTLIFTLTCISLVFYFPHSSYPHQIKGEVTPLMNEMGIVISLIEANKTDLAFKKAQDMLHDSHNNNETRLEEGLKTAAGRIDKMFKTDIQPSLDKSLVEKDSDILKRTLQRFAALLMLEKFNILETNYHNLDSDTQKSVFWFGRNYFSLALEPTLARYSPAEEMQMERLLDRMLYRLEDKKWDEFKAARVELIQRIEKHFGFSLTPSGIEGSANINN
jgi:hypothetical protein